MAKEIERKFLVTDDSYKLMAASSHHISQGYISRKKDGTVRVRIRDNEAFLTIKSENHGISRNEWEYTIPVSDAQDMLEEVCGHIILDKTRWIVEYRGLIWEIDEFHGALAPLVVAEVELSAPDISVELPPFIGREVSDDPEYFNSNLISRIKDSSI